MGEGKIRQTQSKGKLRTSQEDRVALRDDLTVFTLNVFTDRVGSPCYV